MRQIEGRNPVLEALKAGTKISKIYVKENLEENARIKEILKLAKKKNIQIEKKDSLREISKTKGRHQGIIAEAGDKKKYDIEEIIEKVYSENRKPLVLVFSGIDYEHNLGNIMRTSDCVGVDLIIVPRKSFGLSASVVKSSSGASEYVPLIKTNIFAALKKLRELGLKIIGLQENNKKTIYDSNFDLPLGIVVGKEDKGINEQLNKYIDEKISIPMKGKISSLNLAIAGSVCLYEVLRQRMK